jgi:glycosyltransferase involved in cell wall biosynthesis
MASLSADLKKRGHHIELAVDTRRQGELVQRLQGLGFSPRSELALSTKSNPWIIARDVARLNAIAGQFDLWHTNFSHDHLLSLFASRGRNVRVIRTVHSSRSLSLRPMQGFAFRWTDGLIAICESHARALRDRFGVPSQRVTAIRGSVDASQFAPDGPNLRAELQIESHAPVAGIVARIKPDRRHRELIEAFAQMLPKLPEARLLIFGRGEGRPSLEAQIERLGLSRQVIFAGYRTGAELAAAYRTLDVKVLLAEGNDGTCRALLEAMACGRPAIAYRFGAPAETVVDSETGILVEEGQIAALGNAILELLTSSARVRRMGEAARARILKLYQPEQRAQAVEEFFSAVLRLPRA